MELTKNYIKLLLHYLQNGMYMYNQNTNDLYIHAILEILHVHNIHLNCWFAFLQRKAESAQSN